ncbi:hypothetical protein K469DRAFT_682061 [Zopfia rhizophila CBS 207.26]|uniref:Uncharacterized protein n=1 Tax=Zopfia rhizophila CBS 207.26 TaxID=1314779 RepID=A0A6A6EUK0_9PEZI|nr:hypothetical protein K469DRAFT_682061 [Zopfia rhizophila CBS 207.26]
MKFAAVTLLLATLALANPAPAAQPEVAVAQPETRAEFDAALAARNAAPEVEAPKFEQRAPEPKKKPKSGGDSSSNDTEEGAAGMMSPSRVLELGALGLGIMEVVRLWG